MNKKKGDKTENGSWYKVDLDHIDPIKADDEIVKQFDRLSRYKKSQERHIATHAKLLSVRETVATLSDEYLRCSLTSHELTIDDLRRLIIRGCEVEIKEAKEELDKMSKYFKESNI